MASVEILALAFLLFFSTDVSREFLLRAMMFHKKYCSTLVYIAEPLVRVTEGSHKMLLLYVVIDKHIKDSQRARERDKTCLRQIPSSN